MFALHSQLAKDCLHVGDFPLCRLLLMNDSRYPWVILVPQRDAIEEIYQLHTDDQLQLSRESSYLGEAMMQHYQGDKLNIAALGNVVSQLHIHHVVRYRDDETWPAPIWGRGTQRPYNSQELEKQMVILRNMLAEYPASASV